MAIEDDRVLYEDPLWLALEGAINEITDHPDTVWRIPHRHDGLNANEINSLAEEADLSNCLVMEVGEVCNQTGQLQRRWLTVNHPVAPLPIEITVFHRTHPWEIPQSKIDRIIAYLRAWQEKRAEQLKGKGQATEAGDGPAPPNLLIWKGKRHELPPRLWRLLNFMWKRDKAPLQKLEAEVWDHEVVLSNTVNATVSKLNTKLLAIGCPMNLSVKSGYITKT